MENDVENKNVEETENEMELLKKTSILTSERISCSWADAYLRKRKYKKIIKTSVILGLASLITAGLSFMAGAGFKNKSNKILDKYSYDQANELYKQEATVELAEDLANNEITYKQYEQKLDKIDDLDKEDFLKQNASEKDLKEYQSSDVGEEIGVYTGISATLLGLIGLGVAGGIEAKLKGEENRRNAQDARIARICGHK